ncbi:hypothetical protein [Acidovorax sp.]|jgi:hypothetical protein|uniref:hypothetical protein n=1 Tax=Acidovorax sp. TaxID=1872122 RepID=UPI00391F6BD6
MSASLNGKNARPARNRRITCKTLWNCLMCAIALVGVSAALAGERKLSGPQIRSAITGKSVSDGRHWSHHYLADGRLERSENGRNRAGRWDVRSDQLCLLLPEVSMKDPICFDVVLTGGELQYRDERAVVYQGVARPHLSASERAPALRN